MRQAAVENDAIAANPELADAIRRFLAGRDYDQLGFSVNSLIWELKQQGVSASRNDLEAVVETGFPGWRVFLDDSRSSISFIKAERRIGKAPTVEAHPEPKPQPQASATRAVVGHAKSVPSVARPEKRAAEFRTQAAVPIPPKAKPVAFPQPAVRCEPAPEAVQAEAARIQRVLVKAGVTIPVSEAFEVAQAKLDGTAIANGAMLGRLAQVYVAEREALGLKCRASEAVLAVLRSLGAAGCAT